MLEFLNNLKQLWSFKILSFFGYVFIILLALAFFIVPTDIQYLGPIVLWIILTLISFLYIALFITLILIGIFEYQKKNFLEEYKQNIMFKIFSIGLVLPSLIILILPLVVILWSIILICLS